MRAGIQWLLDATSQPALVTDPLTTHVAANSLARALYSPLYQDTPSPVTDSAAGQGPAPWSGSSSPHPRSGGADSSRIPDQANTHQHSSRPGNACTQPNMARFIFLDERAQEIFPAWEQVAADTVAMLRLAVGRHRGDRALSGLIGELSTRSQDFARLWTRHDVLDTCHGSKVIHHPEVGDTELAYEPAAMSTAPDLTVVLYAAEPGSRSADSLRILAAWAACEGTTTSSGSQQDVTSRARA